MILLGGVDMNNDIKETQLDFEQLVEHSLDGIVVIKEGKIIYANKAAKELFSIRAEKKDEKIVGRSVTALLHPHFVAIWNDKVRKIVYNGSPVELMELMMVKTDGTTIPVEITAAPFHYHDEKLVQVIIRDVSDRKAAEERMMQSEKLSVIGELSAGIVHEIRNPLTSIKGFLQLLKSETVVNKDYINIITSEVDRIEEIANELLYFTKPQGEHFSTQDLVTITKEALFLFETEAFKRKISLHFHADEKSRFVDGDKTQLKQVLINLVKNAIEATPAGGHVYVCLSNKDRDVKLTVRDTGSGIPEQQLERLGQSFFTTKEKGTGLGLMVTFNIVKNHNGKIDVESEEHKGTTFTILLPLSKEKEQ